MGKIKIYQAPPMSEFEKDGSRYNMHLDFIEYDTKTGQVLSCGKEFNLNYRILENVNAKIKESQRERNLLKAELLVEKYSKK